MTIQTGIRQKRFTVAPGRKILVIIETEDGTRYKGHVIDASIQSFAAEMYEASELEVGLIALDSRIQWDQNAITLGRVVVQRVNKSGVNALVAFTCIDGKIPLLGSLGNFFSNIDVGADNPLEYELGAEKFSLSNFQETEFAHPDLFEKCRQYVLLHKDLQKKPIYQYYSIKQKSEGARVNYRLAHKNRKFTGVSFASYDYLGYSQNPEVKESAAKAIEKYGVSACGTPILSGKTAAHEELEHRLAKIYGKEDCVLFTTGYATNVGLISSLVRPNDFIAADMYSHISIYDGIQASRARARYFKHNDMNHLRKILEENRSQHHGCMTVSEGIFSMEGTVPNLEHFVNLTQEFRARSYIDECHSIGVFGENGLGVAEHQNQLDRIDILMGSFSKGLGGGACGFVVCSSEVGSWLRFFCKQVMFSASVSPSIVGAANKICDLMQNDEAGRAKLHHNIKRFREGIKKIGLTTPADPTSPIVPIIIGDAEILGKLNQVLLDNGVYTNCILFPAVPIDQCRFRFSITALHSDSDIDMAIFTLATAVKQFPVPT